MKIDEIYAHAPTFLDQDQRQHYYDHGYLNFPSLINVDELIIFVELRIE